MTSKRYVLEECGGACPTQAEGTTADGLPFYFRYRFGYWTLRIFDSEERDSPARIVAEDSVGSSLDGVMSRDEVVAILDEFL